MNWLKNLFSKSSAEDNEPKDVDDRSNEGGYLGGGHDGYFDRHFWADLYIDGIPDDELKTLHRINVILGRPWEYGVLRKMLSQQPILIKNSENVSFYMNKFANHPELGCFIYYEKEEKLYNVLNQLHPRNILDFRKADLDNTDDNEGNSSLKKASMNDHKGIVELLTTNGSRIDKNINDVNVKSPHNFDKELFSAASSGDISKVKELINKGADINFRNDYLNDHTPIMQASYKGNSDIVKLLIQNGADLEMVAPDNGFTALFWGAFYGYAEVVELLLKNGANVNHKNFGDETILFRAACFDRIDIIKLFLEYGGDISINDTSGSTAQYYAQKGGHEEVVKLLEDVKIKNIKQKSHQSNMQLGIKAQKPVKQQIRIKMPRNNPIDYNIREWFLLSKNERKRGPFKLHQLGSEIGKINKQNSIRVRRGQSTEWLAWANAIKLYPVLADLNKSGSIHKNQKPEYQTRSFSDPVVKVKINSLIKASKRGQTETVKSLLANGADVNSPDQYGAIPLHFACMEGHNQIVKILVEAGANINATAKDQKWTPLYIASRNGNKGIVNILLAAGADVNVVNTDNVTPLYIASRSGHTEVVEVLLKAEANVNIGDQYGSTPLYCASGNGHTEIVKTLLTAGANVNVVNTDNFTPLYTASHSGHTEVVEVLLKAGADINPDVTNLFGVTTPLHIASRFDQMGVVKALLEAGANVDIVDNGSRTPLFDASKKGHTEIVKILMAAGADVNAASNSDDTSLLIASQAGQIGIVKTLLTAGANVNATNFYNETSLSLASQYGHTDIENILTEFKTKDIQEEIFEKSNDENFITSSESSLLKSFETSSRDNDIEIVHHNFGELKNTAIPGYKLTFLYRKMAISPDENLLAIAVKDSKEIQKLFILDTNKAGVKLSVPITGYFIEVVFYSDNRLILLSKTSDTQSMLQLIDSKKGNILSECHCPFCDNDDNYLNFKPHSNILVMQAPANHVLTINIIDDVLHLNQHDFGQMIKGDGPIIGPDGECYVMHYGRLYKFNKGSKKEIVNGNHCTCVDHNEGIIYCGGGYADRSGKSYLYLANIKTNDKEDIQFGYEPLHVINLAGKNCILGASIIPEFILPEYGYAHVSMINVKEKKSIWTRKIKNLSSNTNPIVLTAPEDGWALIQTDSRLIRISLSDGSTIDALPKLCSASTIATWLPSKGLLYLISKEESYLNGRLELYKKKLMSNFKRTKGSNL